MCYRHPSAFNLRYGEVYLSIMAWLVMYMYLMIDMHLSCYPLLQRHCHRSWMCGLLLLFQVIIWPKLETTFPLHFSLPYLVPSQSGKISKLLYTSSFCVCMPKVAYKASLYFLCFFSPCGLLVNHPELFMVLGNLVFVHQCHEV